MPTASIAERALERAVKLGLDLSVVQGVVPTSVFGFDRLEPSSGMLRAFQDAVSLGLPWVEGMPVPVLVEHPGSPSRLHGWRIMDGMMRIRAAQAAGVREIP